MRATNTGAAAHRCPVGPRIGADQAAGSADQTAVQRAHRRVVGQPVEGERGAVVAPGRDAVDDQRRAAVAADMAQGDGAKPGSHR